MKITSEILESYGWKPTEQGWYYRDCPDGTTHITINLDRKETVLGSRNCIREAWNIYVEHCDDMTKLRRLWRAVTGEILNVDTTKL